MRGPGICSWACNFMTTANWFFGVIALVFGINIGSFLNVVIWRLPRGRSLIDPVFSDELGTGGKRQKVGHASRLRPGGRTMPRNEPPPPPLQSIWGRWWTDNMSRIWLQSRMGGRKVRQSSVRTHWLAAISWSVRGIEVTQR